MARILLIDDDQAVIPTQVRLAFPAPAHQVQVALTGAAGLRDIQTTRPDVVLLDLRLPDRSGLELYGEIRLIDERLPVVFITSARSADAAIEATRQGAYDYLFKPLDLDELRRVVDEALDAARRMRGADVVETPPEPDFEGAIVGTCPAMREVYKAIGRVSDQDVPVLITGESGTGKELVARAIYKHGRRAEKPYRALNCAAIPEGLLESELFGHEKGAFTSADRRRIGKFEQCDGGTIFLDEIGDMAPALQAKALRLIQDQEFERVGGNEVIRTDVRLIAATHHDLKARVVEEKFRPDLYFRLNVVTIHLPALRERGDDLPMLIHLFLGRFNRRLGRAVRSIDPVAMERLLRYSWPGNVRELQSALNQSLLRAGGAVLLPVHLPDVLTAEPPTQTGAGGEPRHRSGSTLADLEREAIQECLVRSGGSRRRTAELLGISTRTLLRKIREYALEDPLRPSVPPAE